jgi:hypothetical protein
MNKKVLIGTKPTHPARESTAEAWVKQGQAEAGESMRRFTVDVPEGLHRRIKAQCALKGVKMADEIRRILAERFPEQEEA